MAPNQWSFTRLASLLALLTICVMCMTANRAGATATSAWPDAARPMAATVATSWAAGVPVAARLGAEPAGPCARIDGRHAACSIAIVILADGAAGSRPWRCSATAMVTRAGGPLAASRTHTRCVAFPPPSTVPDPAAIFGTAFALNANGDVACLPASAGRVTCVMRYARRCVGAASVPLGRPARAVGLGPMVCRARVQI
jgi:hypothetical protein